MKRRLPRIAFRGVVLFWLANAAARMAALSFEPSLRDLQFDWLVIIGKHLVLALFWIAFTLLCLAWYRTHPGNVDVSPDAGVSLRESQGADLILVDADVSQDIGGLRQLEWVMSRGRLIDAAALRAVVGLHVEED